jgi:hypothetical protein
MTQKIAVLGWGSLIWDPRTLRLNGSWHSDGPSLPVEFARISCDGRLTLVIHEPAKLQTVFWAYIDARNVDEAIEKLREREGGKTTEIIGVFSTAEELYFRTRLSEELKNLISDWAKGKELSHIIWTDLDANFFRKTNNELNVDNIVYYLKNLSGEKKDRAERYVRKAPAQIRTKYRARIEAELGWVPIT